MSPDRVSLRHLPLRARLTLWYVLVLGVALGLFSLYLFFRLHRAVLEQVDAGLRAAAVQALSIVDDEGPTLRFVRGEEPETTRHNLSQVGFAVRLLALDGTVLEGFGSYRDVPLARPVTDYRTLEENNAEWRVYTQPVTAHGRATAGYLQVAQSLTLAEAASEGLLVQIVAGLPLVLALAAAGGWFLADRALRPIDQITRTAQAISANDLAQRIQHTGPDDEIGRLARTFDQMLDRLQAAFERERRFTADASHELRTPLTAIKGQMDVALSRRIRDSHAPVTTTGRAADSPDQRLAVHHPPRHEPTALATHPRPPERYARGHYRTGATARRAAWPDPV
jgi:HAMP domain-containing protein